MPRARGAVLLSLGALFDLCTAVSSPAGHNAAVPCDPKVLDALLPHSPETAAFTAHAWTSSGSLEAFEKLVPPFLTLDELLGDDSVRSALEIGSGTGMLLLEAAFRWPDVDFTGTNLAGSPLPQVDERQESLAAAAKFFELPVACPDFQAKLPSVVLTGDIGSASPPWRQPFFGGAATTFDVVLSQNSLSRAMPDTMHVVIPTLIDLLSLNGTGILELATLRRSFLPEKIILRPKTTATATTTTGFAVLVHATWRFRGGPVSLAITSQSAPGSPDAQIVLLLRRCPPPQFFPASADDYAAGAREDGLEPEGAAAERRGCLLPADVAAAADPSAWPALVAALREIAPLAGSHSSFSSDAWAQRALLDFAAAMERWDAVGRVEEPQQQAQPEAPSAVPAPPAPEADTDGSAAEDGVVEGDGEEELMPLLVAGGAAPRALGLAKRRGGTGGGGAAAHVSAVAAARRSHLRRSHLQRRNVT